MKIEFQYFDDCSNDSAALVMLNEVLSGRGFESEVDGVNFGDDQESADRVQFRGSPTIVISGTDIEPGLVDRGDYTLRCRVYETADGLRGMPERGWIESAVDRALSR